MLIYNQHVSFNVYMLYLLRKLVHQGLRKPLLLSQQTSVLAKSRLRVTRSGYIFCFFSASRYSQGDEFKQKAFQAPFASVEILRHLDIDCI